MKKVILLAAILSSTNAFAIDGSTHYRPEEYNSMSDMDKATVVVNARSDTMNNRTVIIQNHEQAMDLGYENYNGVQANKMTGNINKAGIRGNSKISAKNALLISANSKIGEINTIHIEELFARPQYNDSYVNSRIDNNSSRITRLDTKVDETMAMSAAFSGLPRAYKGESVVGVGVGRFGSSNAIAVGVEHSNGNWSGNLGITSVGDSEAYKAGLGYHW